MNQKIKSSDGLFWTIIIASLLLIVFGSCTQRQDLKTPAIIVAIAKPGKPCENSASVVIRDATGAVYTYPCESDMARSISASRMPGDTIQ